MTEQIVGGLTVLAAMAGGTWLSRWYFTPAGRRREPAASWPSAEALNKFEAHCLAEQRPTLHVRFGTGATQCLECRNPGGGWAS